MLRRLRQLLPPALLLVPVPAQGLTWDVPHRGALLYERTVGDLGVAIPSSRSDPWVVLPGEQGGHAWRYLAGALGGAPRDFMLPGFDDAGWATGQSLFGADARDSIRRTAWTTGELCLRTTVDLGRTRPKFLLIRSHHDDGIRLWWNGRLVVSNEGYGRERTYVVGGEDLDAFQRGRNLFAVQCGNVAGAQYLDVAIAAITALPPGVKTPDELLAHRQRELEDARRAHGTFFGGYRPPAMLLHGELAAGGDRVRLPPADLRELGWFCAMDLSKGVTGGALTLEVARLYRIGDLLLKGRVDPVDADGWQRLDLQIRTLPEPASGEDSNRFVDRFVKPHASHGFEGRIVVRRRLDLQGGKARVAEFSFELTGDLQWEKDKRNVAGVLRQREAWTLRGVRDNQDVTFRTEVAEAIRKGTEHLRRELGDLDKGEIGPAGGERDSYPSGRLAIAVLAMIKGGVPRDDAVLSKALDELRRRRLVDTYSLGNALMALEAAYAPQNEFGDLRAGIIDRPSRRQVPPEDLALMTEWTAQLLANVDTRVNPAYVLRFNYTGAPRYDHSVNQYGLLGLYSAHLCGVPVSPQVWEAAANHLIASQGAPRGRVDLDLTDYRTFARMQRDPAALRTVVRTPVRPAGWNYSDPKDGGEDTPQYGSMTCAGIAGLTICEAGLLDNAGVKRPRLIADIAVSRAAAFGWLAQHLQVRYHPGWIQRQHHFFYYYLYGLERAALLSGIALIQDRDWYFEGATMLVHSQNPDGSWPGELHADNGIERCAMAVLFLKQSTLPVLTGK